MNLTCQCGHCGSKLSVRPEYAGQQVQCPSCQTVIQLPPMSATVVPPQPAAVPLPAPQAPVPTPPTPQPTSQSPASETLSGDAFHIDVSSSKSAIERAKAKSRRKKSSATQNTDPSTEASPNRRPSSRDPKTLAVAGAALLAVGGIAAMLFLGGNEVSPPESNARQDVATGNDDTEPKHYQPVDDNNSAMARLTGEFSGSASAQQTSTAARSGPLLVNEVIERVDDGIVYLTVLDAAGQEIALGSGFLIDQQGLVATNYHVVNDAYKVKARFRNNFEFDVLGYRAWDEKRDLAIVELAGLPAHVDILSLESKSLIQGSDVVAIGNPGGYSFVTTTGIISGLFRTRELPEDAQWFLDAPADQQWIQTNATIAGGSSGGPLLNRQGEVVGINTWINEDVKLGFAGHVQHLRDLLRNLEPEVKPFAEVNQSTGAPGGGAIAWVPEVQTLMVEFGRRMEELNVRLLSVDSDIEQQRVRAAESPAPETARRLLALARKDAGGEAAFQALLLAAGITDEIVDSKIANEVLAEAVELLEGHHLERLEMMMVAAALSDSPLPAGHTFLRTLAGKSPHENVRGLAYFSLATALSAVEDAGEDSNAEIIAALEKVVGDYGDTRWRGTILSVLAEPLLYEQRHLQLGNTAPEIDGLTLDRRPFRLSDFRGKAVVLLFSIGGNPLCENLYPQLRVLARDYANRPFTVAGISLDSYSDLATAVSNQMITWPTCWDGDDARLARRWNISELPTVFVLDTKGVIRRKFSGAIDGRELQSAVDEALATQPTDTAVGKTVPKPTVPMPTVPPADSPDPRKELEERGIRVIGSAVTLADEAKLAQQLREIPKLKNALRAAIQTFEKHREETMNVQQSLVRLRAQSVQLNAQLTSVNPENVAVYNKLVGAVNATAGQINLLQARQKSLSEETTAARKELVAAREAYLSKVLETRQLADAISVKYETHAADTRVQGLLTQINRDQRTEFQMVPSRGFESNLRKLAAIEDTVLSEAIELRKQESTLYVNVNINGKHNHEMVVDSGASLVVMPHSAAASFGVEPTDSDPSLVLTMADGRQMPAKLIVIGEMRVGRFVVRNVECAVLGPEAVAAHSLLGMSFLGQFQFEIDAQAGTLTMVKVEDQNGEGG